MRNHTKPLSIIALAVLAIGAMNLSACSKKGGGGGASSRSSSTNNGSGGGGGSESGSGAGGVTVFTSSSYILTKIDMNSESGSSGVSSAPSFGINQISIGGNYKKGVSASGSFSVIGGVHGN